jgi:hypothetical protein
MKEIRKKPKNREHLKEHPHNVGNSAPQKPLNNNPKHPYDQHKHPTGGCGCS